MALVLGVLMSALLAMPAKAYVGLRYECWSNGTLCVWFQDYGSTAEPQYLEEHRSGTCLGEYFAGGIRRWSGTVNGRTGDIRPYVASRPFSDYLQVRICGVTKTLYDK
jgi:hypothetical protein